MISGEVIFPLQMTFKLNGVWKIELVALTFEYLMISQVRGQPCFTCWPCYAYSVHCTEPNKPENYESILCITFL